MLMGSQKLQAQEVHLLNKTFTPIQLHQLNLYRVECEKCKLDVETLRQEVEDMKVANMPDHSLTVVVGFVALLLGTIVGISVTRGNN